MDVYEEIVKLRREGRRGAVATIVQRAGLGSFLSHCKMLVPGRRLHRWNYRRRLRRGRSLASGQGSHGAGEASHLKVQLEPRSQAGYGPGLRAARSRFSSNRYYL